MRESIYALRCDFLCLQYTQSERTRWRYACANLHIGSLTCFSRHNFRTQHFYQNRYLKNKASATLNPLVSLFGRLVARSGRKRGNRQTDGRKEGRTDGMTTNPLAHARRVLINYRHIFLPFELNHKGRVHAITLC